MWIKKRAWVLGVAMILGVATSLMAGTTGKIVGRVVDADTKEGLPGANVVIEGTHMGTATDMDGYYVILNVPPGTYTIKASMLGYQSMVVKGVVVEADRTTEVNFRLKPTVIKEKEIVVVAKAPVIKKDLTASVNIVSSKEVQTLPVSDVSQVVTQQAGIISRGGLHVRGGRAGEAVYVVDGVEVRDPYSNYTTAGIPLLSMEETSVSRGGFDVDQGTVASGVFNVITKEGGPKYEFTTLYQTGDFSWLGDKAYAVLDANVGDPYYDLLVHKRVDLSDPVGRHKAQPHHFEFALGGPVLPTSRKGAKFFVSGYFNRDKGRFPVSADPEWNNWEERYQWKLSIPASNFKFFTSGFLNRGMSKGYSPYWRLALDHMSQFRYKRTQFILGMNYLFSSKTYLELRAGVFEQKFTDQDFEDVDFDGIDDFSDRDWDGYVEVDMDYFKDSLGNTINLDSLLSVIPVDSFYYEETGHWYETGDGWVELPLHWWSPYLAGLYPSVGSGPEWWSDNPEYSPNRYQWGRRSRVDIVVGWVGDSIFIGTKLAGDTLVSLDKKDTVAIDSIYVKIGNQYLNDLHTWERGQWYAGLSKSYTFTGRFTSQVTKVHEILAGFEYKRFEVERYGADYASGGNFYYTFVEVPFIKWFEEHPSNPWQMAFYLRDKIESEGMIAKIGFRVDYLNTGGWYPADSLDPFEFDPVTGWGFLKNPQRAKPKWHISPRIGVSHPISERDVLHFTYGHYFQLPQLSQVLANYVFSGAFPIIGNPNVKPEKQIAYELGVKHAFTNNIVLDVTAYYKDIKNWVRAKMIYLPGGGGGRNYTTYVNEDYGDVRGIEFDFNKRPGGALLPYFGFRINYTFQVAKGSFSTPGQAYNWAWRGYPMPDQEHPLDWDQRHTLQITLSLVSPDKNHPLFGISDWGISLIHHYGSGYPYTPPIRTPREAMELINSKRLPPTYSTDMRFYKNFRFGPVYMRGFVDIYNIFNNKQLTGFDNVEWYEQFHDPEGEVKNPTVWSSRRTTRIGIEIQIKEQ